jgi:hypothetical protein
MIVKLKKSSLDFLLQKLSANEPALYRLLDKKSKDQKITFEINNPQADEIRDWIEEEIQRVGYDESYNLNSEGQILQDLADKLYS